MGLLQSLFGGKKEKTAEDLQKENAKKFDILKFDGIKALRIGKLPYAERCFIEALALQDDYTTRMNLIQLYVMQNQLQKALEQLKALADQNDEHIDTYLTMASVCESQEQWAQVKEACDKALALDENRAEAYYYLGKYHFAENDPIQAIVTLTRSLALDDTYQPAYMARYEVLKAMGQFQEAEKDADQLIALDAANEAYLLLKADALLFQGKTTEATNHYLKVIELNAFCGQAYLALGTIWIESKEYEKTLTLLDEAIEMNTLFAEAYKLRGQVKMLMGDKVGAAEDLKQSLELAPAESAAINGQFSNIEQQINQQYRANNPFMQ